jgi:phosphate transport system permease protein
MATTVHFAGPTQAVNRGDRVFRLVAGTMATLVLVILLAMVITMAQAGSPAFSKFGLGFIIGQRWDPVHLVFGALPFIYGTIVSSMLALCLAVPLGLGVTIFLSEFAAPLVREPVRFVVELLVAIPSVVYGLWGLFVFVPWLSVHVQVPLSKTLGFLPLFAGPPLGIGMMAAGMILAIMVLPLIVAVGVEVLRAVPRIQREAAIALGATPWETTRIAVLPYARSGLIGAVILALARALGETMAVTMLIGNRPEIQVSLFAPGYSIAAVIANEFAEATSEVYVSALIAIGLVLFLVTVFVNIIARLLVARVGRGVQEVRE